MANATHDPLYYWTVAGRTFTGKSTAPKTGAIIPISDSTAPIFALWNPAGSRRYLVLHRFSLGWVSTTGAPAGIGYNVVTNAGNTAATGNPVAAFTHTAPTNMLVGGGLASSALFANGGTITLTTAGTEIDQMGVSQLTITGASTAVPMWTAVDEFKGRCILPPGTFWYPTGSAAPLSKYNIGLTWYEVDIDDAI